MFAESVGRYFYTLCDVGFLRFLFFFGVVEIVKFEFLRVERGMGIVVLLMIFVCVLLDDKMRRGVNTGGGKKASCVIVSEMRKPL